MSLQAFEDLTERHRLTVSIVMAILLGTTFIAVLTLLLPAPAADGSGGSLSAVLLDRGRSTYPFTMQNLMWLVFAVGMAEVLNRFGRAKREYNQLHRNLLPEDNATILRSKDLIPIFRKLDNDESSGEYRLQRIIRRAIQQFQISGSVNQANGVVNSSLDLLQHEIDLKYGTLRYIVWVIPTLGFIGTVIGIALALGGVTNMPSLEDSLEVQLWFGTMASELGFAFYTTFLALVLAAVLVLMQNIAQGKEEAALNATGRYCLDNLVNRLYEE